jgi:hypothetical protein
MTGKILLADIRFYFNKPPRAGSVWQLPHEILSQEITCDRKCLPGIERGGKNLSSTSYGLQSLLMGRIAIGIKSGIC